MRRLPLTAPVLALVVSLLAPAHAMAVPDFHPSKLSNVDGSQQVVVVGAGSWNSKTAVLRGYERRNGAWVQVIRATRANLGWNGLAPESKRRQGSGTTPAGTFAIPSAFGRFADPGTELPYRKFDRDDTWTYHPKSPSTYNVFQTAKRNWSGFSGYIERLWSYTDQYQYVAVMDYNLPRGPISTDKNGIRRTKSPANTRKGGGIFLHVSNGTSTAGCISIPLGTMRDVLTWLDPDKDPKIVVGPRSVLQDM